MISKTILNYKILEKLASATLSSGFLPHNLFPKEEEKTRFLHRTQTASALNHQNIMIIYRIDESESKILLVMEKR